MLNFFNNLSIRYKLISTFSLFAVLVGVFIFIFFPHQQKKQILHRVMENSLTIARMTADNAAASLEFQDKGTAQEVLNILQDNGDFEFVLLKNASGKLFAGINLDAAPSLELNKRPLIPGKGPVIPTSRMVNNLIITTLPIQSQNTAIGSLVLGLSLKKVQTEIATNNMIALAVSVALVALLILASIFIGNRLTEPIQKVISLSSSIAEGDFSNRLAVTSQDEIGKLTHAINEMSIKLKKSIEELEQSEERYEKLIEFADVGIVAAEKNQITQVNRKAIEIYGYSKEDLLGQPPGILSTKEYSKDHEKLVDELLQFGEVKQTVFEEEGKRKDGSLVPIEVSYSISQATEKGMYNIIAIMRDITERKKAEKEIHEARDFLENIINNSVDGIMIVDPQGHITRVNEALKKMVGYTQEELIGKHSSELASREEEHPKISADTMAQLFEEGFLENAEAVWKSKDNVLVPIEVNMAMLKNTDGGIIGGVSSIRDITDRKKHQEELKKAYDQLEERVEERTVELQQSNEQLQWEIKERTQIEQELVNAKEIAESANKAKSDFLANMSHELRTPLNHIIGFTELVLDKNFGDLNETQSEYLGDVLQSSQHLLSLINDILDLSKVEAGKQELEPTNVNLKDLLERSLIMFKEKTLKHGLQLSLDVDHIPEIITADERKLKQIIYNLVSNAVKFTPEGGSVALSACHLSSDNGHWKKYDESPFHVPMTGEQSSMTHRECVAISVKDTGIGLQEDDVNRIFNPFEQVDSSSSRKYQGTGLGLSLCKNLVELHGGIIWAESEGEGKGTTLKFIIPT